MVSSSESSERSKDKDAPMAANINFGFNDFRPVVVGGLPELPSLLVSLRKFDNDLVEAGADLLVLEATEVSLSIALFFFFPKC